MNIYASDSLRIYIGTKGEVCRQLKIFLTPAAHPLVVYATYRSKAVVPVLFLILCSFVVYTTGRLCFKIFSALCPRFSVCFSILITSLGEGKRELVFVLLVNCLFCTSMF